MNRRLYILAMALGALATLLLTRLILQLFAARLDNPVFAAVRAVSAPFVAPLAGLDARQPRFGAVLEWSTLALLLLTILIIVGLAGALSQRRNRAARRVQ